MIVTDLYNRDDGCEGSVIVTDFYNRDDGCEGM